MPAFLLTIDGQVATLTFNRPEKRNPLNVEVLLELESLLHSIRDDTNIRVLLLTSTGNTFCAGADLSVVKGITNQQERERILRDQGVRRTSLTARVALVLRELEQVTIAAINGYAVGGGWMLTMACDYCIAVEQAEFWLPEVDLSVPFVPEGCRLLLELVGPARAKEIVLTCRRYRAVELQQLGLIHQVAPLAQCNETALTLARRLIAKNQDGMAWSKATISTLIRGRHVMRQDLFLARG